MTTPAERLKNDVEKAIECYAAMLLRCGEPQFSRAPAISREASSLAYAVIRELRIRWTIIERPRKQRTLRQES